MREKILRILKQGGPVSGEQLGKQLGISRTAVWKHVRELRARGYQIESSTNRGYSLIKSSDLILPEEIADDLPTKFIGKRIVHYDEVTSTQDIAHELAKKGAEEGTAVVAEMQTKGKGRKGKTWVSPQRGGIYVSIVLRPNLRPVHVVQIPLVVGVALARAIKDILPLNPKIKWPNDIFIGNKKVAGILTEMNSELDKVNYVIPGIGINVNTEISNLPDLVKDTATSLSFECGREVSRIAVIKRFFVELETVYEKFLALGFSSIRDEWKSLTNTLGCRVKVFDDRMEITGEAFDLDRDGFLLIKKDDGTIETIVGGEVSLVKE
jgi:BirA family transcriptional regulator, biotin operon repressor / biotin---[acetyl-CoA-carboxylase] ligase